MNKYITTQNFIQKAKAIHGNKYDYSLVNYRGYDLKLKIICIKHGVFKQKINAHVNSKQGCPKCAGKNKTTKQFIQEAKEIHRNRYGYKLVEYIGAKSNINIVCKKHGIFKQTPNRHLLGAGCIKCAEDEMANNRRKTKEQFLKQTKEAHGTKYDYSLMEYTNDRTKIKIICPIHKSFEQYPTHHIRGVGCPKCKISKGETKIIKHLDHRKILYEYQKKFINSEIPRLKFDFYLPELRLLIEYNGIQHYEPIKFFGGEKKFNKQQIIDEKKRTFAKTNDYTLLEIPYYLTNPIGIITQQIKKCQSV